MHIHSELNATLSLGLIDASCNSLFFFFLWNVMQGIQEAGETVYIPPGWMHGVVNLEPTLAVTENFIPKLHPSQCDEAGTERR